LPPLSRRTIDISPSRHGGANRLEMRDAGFRSGEVIDFSVNVNPFGPPPAVLTAWHNVAIEKYPDPESSRLKSALADHLGVDAHNILVGNGTAELIRLLALAFLDVGDVALVPQPSFGEYAVACKLAGASVTEIWAREEDGYEIQSEEIVSAIQRLSPRIVFLGNPNNPTGQYFDSRSVEELIEADSNCLVVIDEAFIGFVDDSWESLRLAKRDNVVLLRSMTKDYALAGLRLGYAVSTEPVIAALKGVQPPWSVNVAAQNAGVLALQDAGYVAGCRVKLCEARDYLKTELSRLGLAPRPSRANFLIVKVAGAGELRRQLISSGIVVRDCTSFGMPDYVRLAVRTMPECRRLIEALKESAVNAR
jgi:histidinol-phosphate aminotransferase